METKDKGFTVRDRRSFDEEGDVKDEKETKETKEPESQSKEEQEKILESALNGLEFCSAKGRWGSAIADEAKHKINDVKYHLDYLEKMTEGVNIPRHMIVDNQRMIREAYRDGYKNPYMFGKRIILECLENGY